MAGPGRDQSGDRRRPTPEAVEGGLRAAFDTGSDTERSVLDLLGTRGRRRAAVAEPAETGLARYQVLGEIGRGGVGIVLRGRDRDLGRDVALKVLREDLADEPDIVRRFVEEAQIEGQLQHPGIVPVYGLGLRPDGRPYFAMKLIEGRTLAEILGSRSEPADDLHRHVGAFGRVCEAVAYAHARGVVHRDLKPANVLVGAFGEVQVVDWGFAKVLARGAEETVAPEGEPDRKVVRTVRSGSEGSASRAGSVLGTPAYMPPEQALGEVDRIDARSDVFSLGAILGEILTGRPPYVREDGDLLSQAAGGKLDPARARLDASGADAELVALARSCLAEEPDRRPRDAGELAAAIAAHLAAVEQRARSAELAAAEARVKAEEERKKRRISLALAAAVLLLVVGGGGGAWWAASARRARVEATNRRVTASLREAERLWGEAVGGATDRWAAALAEARKAVDLAAGADEATRLEASELEARLEEDAARAERDARMVATLEEIRLQRGETDKREAIRRFAEAFRAYGIDAEALDESETTSRIRASAVRAELTATLDTWARLEGGFEEEPTEVGARLLRIARAADGDEWRNRLRDAGAARDVAALRELATAHLESLLDGNGPNLLADLLEKSGERALALSVLEEARRRRPHVFWLNAHLAGLLLLDERAREAIGHALAARALRPMSAFSAESLAEAYRDAGRYDDALRAFEDAIRLATDDELRADYRYETGRIHGLHARYDEAREAYRLAAKVPTRAALATAAVAGTLQEEGRQEESIPVCEEALRLQDDLAFARALLGRAHLRVGRFREALVHLEQGRYETDSKGPFPSVDRDIRLIGRMLEIEPRVEAILEGRDEPADWVERVVLSRFCQFRGRHLASARLLGGVVEDHPEQAPRFRFDAACYAIVAARGRGPDSSDLEADERRRWRDRALGWLQEQLERNRRLLLEDPDAHRRWQREAWLWWKRDPQLADVRGDALAALSEEEQKAWAALWASVDAVLERTRE